VEETVIVGGGQAGMQAAMNLRGYGYAGKITILGEEAHAPYERPPLSKVFLIDADAPMSWVAQEEDASINFKAASKVTEINRQEKYVQLSDGSHFSYTNLVLAMGGECRKLVMESSAPFYEVRTVDDAKKLYTKLGESKHVTIVGAGVIGLEVASSARKRGLKVSVIEYGSHIMSRNMPVNFAAKIKELHDNEGVDFHMNDTIKSVQESGAESFVQLEGGAQLNTDCIVLGIGITPNISLAEESGLAIGNGILVSKDMRTSDPDIFAVGDIACSENERTGQAERIESWHNANATAKIAAAAICDESLPPFEVPWFWSDQYGTNIQVAGWPMLADKTIWRESGEALAAFYLLKDELVGACCIDAGADMSVIRRMLNAGISPSAEDLADPAVRLRGLLKALRQ
jgi:3-phenylpropionate/trans-cinnamate dioxygenase ferredoxin reductase subunit